MIGTLCFDSVDTIVVVVVEPLAKSSVVVVVVVVVAAAAASAATFLVEEAIAANEVDVWRWQCWDLPQTMPHWWLQRDCSSCLFGGRERGEGVWPTV